MDILLLYLFAQVDQIIGVFGFFAVLFGMATAIMAALYLFATEGGSRSKDVENLRPLRRWFIITGIACFCCTLIATLVPSQKGIAIIVGGHFALEATRSETAKKIFTIVDGVLDKQIEQLSRKGQQ